MGQIYDNRKAPRVLRGNEEKTMSDFESKIYAAAGEAVQAV